MMLGGLGVGPWASGCTPAPAPKLGGASRPAYPPKRMANTYDVVAYVDDGRAEVGTRRFQTVHAGGLYFFASGAHRDRFKENPSRYVPAFEGWCSAGMAKGMRLPPSGEDFEVMAGQLYLFHDAAAHSAWKADPSAAVAEATRAWRTGR